MSVRPLVMAGPSGVGKGTLIARLMKDFPGSFGFCVSHTTRSPRPGEEDGIAYHFTELGAMKKMVEAGHFLEYADVHGNLYGTSRAAVEKVAQAGCICILDIDVMHGRDVFTGERLHAVTWAPALEARLRGRGTETEARVQRRLANAAAEIGYATERGGANFDAVLVNDDLEQCYAQLKAPFPPTHAADTLRKTYPRTHARRRSPFPGSTPATRKDSACSAVRSCVALPSLHAPALLLRSRGTHAASRALLDCGDDEGGVPGLRSPKTPSPSASPKSPTKSKTQPPARASASSTEAS
ncbi:hypothetical protein EMIHUDRAFT_450399 [Emiliania huxleyi CCMP1516]|uniref:Guanylate kinase-like domain-containing protein n=2 Tax=Emiliania huxleyi TaxID=2903 RepID=A0A0D3JQP0_EMIH1|nr:hypothetical protein EMIHUDRAFT_450399 [Emiliania huxleyi CCMP1516]EOD25825.1 hypothetical protein EMIHUDRAFT_450399 [Emiliania huxleyi CCMP1516]|eukprot:XP_005778254.1 hypothetical protein EMIHUDRAFT_450399 [Emiliania huxleyi CCMP1516]